MGSSFLHPDKSRDPNSTIMMLKNSRKNARKLCNRLAIFRKYYIIKTENKWTWVFWLIKRKILLRKKYLRKNKKKSWKTQEIIYKFEKNEEENAIVKLINIWNIYKVGEIDNMGKMYRETKGKGTILY